MVEEKKKNEVKEAEAELEVSDAATLVDWANLVKKKLQDTKTPLSEEELARLEELTAPQKRLAFMVTTYMVERLGTLMMYNKINKDVAAEFISLSKSKKLKWSEKANYSNNLDKVADRESSVLTAFMQAAIQSGEMGSSKLSSEGAGESKQSNTQINIDSVNIDTSVDTKIRDLSPAKQELVLRLADDLTDTFVHNKEGKPKSPVNLVKKEEKLDESK